NTNTTTFTHVTVPLTVVGTPAKCQITFTVVNPGGGIVIVNLGSTITLDDIELTGVIGIDELKENSDLVVYPNPVHDRMLMQVTTTPGEKITWSLTDASGKVVATRKSEIVSSDILKDEMQLPQLAKGFYVLSLQSDTRRATRRVVIE
ncbi:MAG TPA: T9SS type A sorting domain-containing protein, partial [Bacteroidia bacterium]|nr:T9SS type A sorting domain-containing protein [Bacteroidia bacterium]